MPAITFDEFWSWEAAADLLPEVLTAFVKVTLLVTVVGTLVAVVVGMLLAVLTRVAPRIVAAPVRWVMDVIRMTPLIVQLVFASYLVPVSRDLLWVGTAVIGIHYSTYMAESFIGGIRSVDPGQWEAARALSLPQGRTRSAIVLPQAVRSTLPAPGNWMISMFKDTPYLFAITVLEMVTVAQQAGGSTFPLQRGLHDRRPDLPRGEPCHRLRRPQIGKSTCLLTRPGGHPLRPQRRPSSASRVSRRSSATTPSCPVSASTSPGASGSRSSARAGPARPRSCGW
ncbi:amino acid ABC transporter permease [Janibacter limosus]|uniref:amino acid ABC transporter permease n=1 Tax=Janibacter limosus TaxID=53458 RepID=UPI0035D5C550